MNEIDQEIDVFDDNDNNFGNSSNTQSNNDEKPVFLKVLCILSWIFSGFNVFTLTFYNLFINEESKNDILKIMSKDENSLNQMKEQLAFLDVTSKWILFLFIFEILFVYMIWNLKKIGFYGYITVQILLILVNFLFYPFSYSLFFELSILPMIFIFMYGTNLKYMIR